MKTFDEIYDELENADNSEINNLLEEIKIRRKKAHKIAIIICLVTDIIIFLMFWKKGLNATSLYIILIALIINLFLFIIVEAATGVSKKKAEFNTKYKNIVIGKLINNFYNSVEYFPDKPMPEYMYRQLEYEHYNRYKSDDYLEAQIDNKYSIQMAEIHTEEEETYRDSDGHTHTRTYTRFHGLFAKIILDKSIKSDLKIVLDGKMLLGKNKLKMDSSEFEKIFDVKASNKIIGMQLLTADVMEELVEFKNNTNMPYDIYITNNELYLRFHSGSMFEPRSLKNGVLDRNVIHKYFYMLNFTYNLSKKLIDTINNTYV